MGIKLIKKESMEGKGHWVVYLRGEEWCTRNTEKEAQAVVNSYDGEGDCWYEFVADEADEANADKSYVLAHKGPNDTTYCKNKAGDWTTHIEDAWDGSGPDSFSAEMKRNFADAVHCEVEDLEVILVEKFESKGANGFFHIWELQAQQAKETLEEITRKFGDADRLAFEIRNFPHTQECDVVVTVDGNPFITAEFEGGKHSGIRWHCFEDDVTDTRLDVGDEYAAKDMILAFKDVILDALTSLYGFGAIADEGNQLQESKEGTVKQEANWNTLWCVEFCDIYRNVKKEYYDTEAEAKARYDELAERGDIEWVEDPVKISQTIGVSYAKYAESVKAILMGREFEYGPETANEFVEDDYKDIVRKNYDAFESPFKAAADIDDVYMRKE